MNFSSDGEPLDITIYNGAGEVIYHIEHPHGSLPWHYHIMDEPGNLASGHGQGKPHLEIYDLNAFMEELGFLPDWNTPPD